MVGACVVFLAAKHQDIPYQQEILASSRFPHLLACFPSGFHLLKMPPPGYVFRDGGTTPPAVEDPNSAFRKRITTATTSTPTSHTTKPITATSAAPLGQNTTTSHQLATGHHEIEGAAQRAGKTGRFTNLGWQANAVGVDTLVGGLENDDLWTLMRRFNKASHISQDRY